MSAPWRQAKRARRKPARAQHRGSVARYLRRRDRQRGAIIFRRSTGGLYTGGGGGSSYYALPADRSTLWNPGVTLNGGIPARTTIFTTVSAGASVATIQSAINSCPSGQTVLLGAGTFTTNSYILVPSNITLRGSGPGVTILQKTDGAVAGVDNPGADASPIIIVGAARFANNQHGVIGATNLTSDAVKGAYSVTVASTTGLSVGQLVLIDELSNAAWQTDPNGRGLIWAADDFRVAWQKHSPGQGTDDPLDPTDFTNSDPNGSNPAASWFCRTGRPTAEVKIIAQIVGTTVTFSTPFHIDYRTANTAQLARYEYAKVSGAGVESLSMTGGSNGSLRFNWTDSCWAKDVEISTWRDEGIAIDHSFRTEVRHSYLHDAAYASPGGAGYAISPSTGSSEYLVEDNIIVRANKVMVARSAGAGAVVAYNYCDQGYIIYNLNWQEMGVNGSHMVGPHHTLFEGNYTFNLDSDKTHGNSVYQTYFRNYASGFRLAGVVQGSSSIDDTNGSSGPLRTVGPASLAYWFSFVGNVLGTPGAHSGWAYSQNIMLAGPAIWSPGWDDWTPQTPMDANVLTSLLRDGNFDYKTNQVHWHGIGGSSLGDTTPPAISTLPSSLYLSSKPAFFGSNTWPWVDAQGATKTYTLPAKARYDLGTPFA